MPPKSLRSLLLVVAMVLCGRASLADHYVVPTGSMMPSVKIGDRLIVNKLAYGLRIPFTHVYVVETGQPRVGDVVVLDSPTDGNVLLKRVVAVPGDTVEISSGTILLNGTAMPLGFDGNNLLENLDGLSHPVLLTHGGGPDLGPVTLKANEYLLVGDNRGDSYDGRFWGFVPRQRMLGRAMGIYLSNSRPTWRSFDRAHVPTSPSSRPR